MMRFVVAGAVAIGLGAAIFWTGRMALADHYFRQGDPDRAAATDPLDARYRLGRSERHPGELSAAARLNPSSSRAWIDLGLRAEAASDVPVAERHLLEAARVDATWLPRWTLANFYFRRGDRPRFWKWAAKAGRMAYGDSRALYDLCWMVEPDARKILAEVVADRAEPMAWFYHFLLARKQLDPAAEVLDRLVGYGRAQDRPETAAFCDIAIDAGRQQLAVQAWNRAVSHGLLPYQPVGEPNLVTNGDFAIAPLHRGFDWRLPPVEGVTDERGASRGLRLTLGRSMPDRCDLLWQYLPATAGSSYRVDYQYDAEAPPSGAGLRWTIRAGEAVIASSEPLGMGEGRKESLPFRARTGATPRLVLVYEREAGRSPWEGTITLREVSAVRTP